MHALTKYLGAGIHCSVRLRLHRRRWRADGITRHGALRISILFSRLRRPPRCGAGHLLQRRRYVHIHCRPTPKVTRPAA